MISPISLAVSPWLICVVLIAQMGVGFAEGALALQVEGDIEHGVDLFLGPLLGGDHVTAG
jgi:hypothetical protein